MSERATFPEPARAKRLTRQPIRVMLCCHRHSASLSIACLSDVQAADDVSCSSDEEEYFTSAEAMGRSDIVGKIDRIACPMLLMHGMCECSSHSPTRPLGLGLASKE